VSSNGGGLPGQVVTVLVEGAAGHVQKQLMGVQAAHAVAVSKWAVLQLCALDNLLALFVRVEPRTCNALNTD
jgi:hypothetical protein